MILSDNELVLRAIEERDAPVLLSMINDPELEHAVVGWSRPVSTSEQAAWIAALPGENTVRWAVDEGSDMLGTVSVSAIDWKNRTGALNIKLLARARGRGVGTRAMTLVIAYCFEELNLNCLSVSVMADNLPSLLLWEKLGFRTEGCLRQRVYKQGRFHDLQVMSLLREEYHAGNRQ